MYENINVNFMKAIEKLLTNVIFKCSSEQLIKDVLIPVLIFVVPSFIVIVIGFLVLKDMKKEMDNYDVVALPLVELWLIPTINWGLMVSLILVSKDFILTPVMPFIIYRFILRVIKLIG